MAGNRITANGDGGVRIITRDAPAQAARLESNVIAANNAVGVALNNAPHLLLNNTVASNFGAGVTTAGQGRLANNLIAFNRTGISGGVSERAGNNIFGNFFGEAPDSTPGPGDISADPLLASTRYGDFHIQPRSPCVGAGSGMYELAYPDVDGQLRISGASVDIGADESYGEARAVTPRIIRVSAASTAAFRDGASWETAYASLEEAMQDCAANGPAQVWLAQGTYRPEVRLLPFVTVHGGFRGYETSLNEAMSHPANTLLLPPADALSAISFSNASVLESARIANATPGAFCYRAAASIERCRFQNNLTALFIRESSPTLISSVIEVYWRGIEVQSGDPLILNNTVYRPVDDEYSGTTCGMQWTGGNAYVANSIFAHCSTSILWSDYQPTSRAVYNTVCFPSTPLNITGYTLVDPWNSVGPPGGGDVSLNLRSPLVDAGLMPVPAFTALDFYGRPRIAFGRVDIGACELGDGGEIAAAKRDLREGQTALISGIVTGVYTIGYYLQSFPDTNSARVNAPGSGPTGILVSTLSSSGIARGMRVVVGGTMGTRDGEACIRPSTKTLLNGAMDPQPVQMTCATIGGGNFGLQQAVERWSLLTGQRSTMQGLSNVGLLVSLVGRVTYRGYLPSNQTYIIKIDDGSGYSDGEYGNGIRVDCGPHVPPAIGSTVRVAGVSGIRKNSQGYSVSVLRVSRAEDMEVLED